MDLIEAIERISQSPTPWGQQMGVLLDLAHLEARLLEFGGIPPEDATAYLFRVHALSWAVKLHWKPKRYRIYAPRGHRDTFKPIGAVYASVMELCEKLHSFTPSGTYTSAAHWFRLIVEETEIAGLSSNLGKTEDISRLQKENALLGADECPFRNEHTVRLISLAIAGQRESQTLKKAYRQFVRSRKSWATALKSPAWKALISKDERLYFAAKGRTTGGKIKGIYFTMDQKLAG